MTHRRLADLSGCPLFFSALISVFSVAFPLPAAAQPSASAASEENGEGWVLAASAFELYGVPEEYAAYATLMPLLIIDRLGAAQVRFVNADERQARELRERFNDRMSLVDERRNLIFSRDSLFFSFDDDDEKKEKRDEYNEMIEEKNKEIAELDKALSEDLLSDEDENEKNGESRGRRRRNREVRETENPVKENLPVIFRVEGEESLYKPQEGVSLAQSLYRDGISGLLTGEIRDIGGYMYVSASVETGYGAVSSERVSYTAHYDDLEDAVEFFAFSLLPQISNRQPVRLYISALPEDADVFVDGVMVHNMNEPVAVFAGTHTIEASAQGYAASILTTDFTESDEFNVDISLLPLESVKVIFDTGDLPASLFLRTQYFGAALQEAEIPAIPQIGEVVYGDVQTFFVFNPSSGLASFDDRLLTASVSPDEQTAERRISRQRRILYWSLGALYLALPAAFLLTGEANSRTNAYNMGRLTDSDSIRPWTIAGNVSVGVCIALGVNLVIQAARYLIAANQVVPREVEFR